MARQIYKYKDKSVTIALFNESQSYYQKYKELINSNPEEAKRELNTAGNKLQQSFELGLKYYLNRRYRELYEKSILSWTQHLQLVRVIENGRQVQGAMVDIRYLSEQMDLYAMPNKAASGVDFDLIKNNAKYISNDNKHKGNDVDVKKYEESYAEIRKFILTYVDDNPPIQMIQSPEYMNLQEACDFWQDTSRYNYCLIYDECDLDDVNRRKILYIKWALILDFDTKSSTDGLIKSYVNEYGVQPNSFNIGAPQNTVFNAASNVPYWFHINGVDDVEDSLVDTDRRWNQKYGAVLLECFRKYREVFSKPLKVVVLSGNAKRIEKIITELDSVYEDLLKIYLLSQEVQFEGLRQDYSEILEFYPLTGYEFAQGINNFSSLFDRIAYKSGCCVPGKEGKVEVKLEEYSCFEIPYLGIEEECDSALMECENFYQGANTLSWYGAKNGFAINRIVQYRKIKNEIVNARTETTSRIIRLNHDPGAGGTTLSRMIAYDLSKDMPVLLLTSYNDRIAPIQVSNFYRKVGMSILVVVESAIISEDELQKFNGELMAKAVPHVILFVSRIGKRTSSTDDDLRYLVDSEFVEMEEKLAPYLTDDKKTGVKQLLHKQSERYPFFMAMYAFEERFKGVKDYVEHYLVNINSSDYDTLVYISMVDWFANRALDISFFNQYEKDALGLFEDPINNNLIIVDDIGHNSFVKMRHPRFAEEIVNARIAATDNYEKANNFSILIREFIRFSKRNILLDLDSTIDVLKNLLILRDAASMINSRFAPVIEYLSELVSGHGDENEKYNCIGLIFKELVEVYPEEPHFRAHLSRYYSHIERNYERGISEAKEAVILAEQQGGFDVLLYHIYGTSIRRYVEQKLYVDAKECLKYGESKILSEKLLEIENNLKYASEQFEKVRATNNKIAGYVSDIEMCIALIDFAKEIYGCTTEEFVIQYKDSWMMEYYDRALTLMEGFRTIQVEEDTEFKKVHLKAKCTESLQDMLDNIGSTIVMWQEYLDRADDTHKPVVRRFIARAKERNMLDNDIIDMDSVKSVLQLMEENIKQEPENGANIRIWFNALRYVDDSNDDMLLDDALQKLALWKRIGDNFEAYYYFFILTCIKAIEGSSRAEAIIPELQEELKSKTAHMPNNRVIYEWLGEGKGVHRLINSYESKKGKYYKRSLEVIEQSACYLEGRITKYKNERSAQIRAFNMEVFFSPSGQGTQVTQEDVNKNVKFILGFSYDGLRALNRSVKLIDYASESVDSESIEGKIVKCSVIGPDSAGNFLKVKLMDYRNVMGSVHSSQLPEGKNVFDYKYQDVVWGTVIGTKKVEREGRVYYQIRMKEESEELSDWQKQLLKVNDKIRKL